MRSPCDIQGLGEFLKRKEKGVPNLGPQGQRPQTGHEKKLLQLTWVEKAPGEKRKKIRKKDILTKRDPDRRPQKKTMQSPGILKPNTNAGAELKGKKRGRWRIHVRGGGKEKAPKNQNHFPHTFLDGVLEKTNEKKGQTVQTNQRLLLKNPKRGGKNVHREKLTAGELVDG